MRPTTASASRPGTFDSAARRLSSSSSSPAVVKCISWSARSAASASAGSTSRAATIARQARAVADMRGFSSKL